MINIFKDVTKTGNREPGSGNECTAVTHLIIQNGRQRKRKGNSLGNVRKYYCC